MTLPPDPTLFLAHCKAHKTPTQSQPCKELKMPTHNPPAPADEYLSALEQHFSSKSLLGIRRTEFLLTYLAIRTLSRNLSLNKFFIA